MEDIFESLETSYVDAQTLLIKLKGYKKPRDWIARQVKLGKLMRLKNGFFVITKRPYSLPQLANLIYGPSYVSLQWALSYYGLIPERSEVITSVTTRRNKKFESPIGQFTYRYLNQDRYSRHFKQANEEKEKFLIATPEKAVVDFVYFFCVEETIKGLFEELIESHRFSIEDLKSLDISLLTEISLEYHSPIVDCLIKVMREI